ncbi:MAG: hypothetical protein J6Y74_04815 [Clostridia bacterium]|nr:hypothetical protein [Clostridia bacterium]
MEEEKKEGAAPEKETDFSYMAKLAEAYKQAQEERRKARFPEEKRGYLREMQAELAEIGRFLLHYFERAEKKELATMLLESAESVLHAISEEGDQTKLFRIEEASDALLTRAVLLANRSLRIIGAGQCDLFRKISSEISALYALAAIA